MTQAKQWSSTRKLILGSVLVFALFGMYPMSYTFCPDWNVTVVDAAGAPVPGMTVRRSCNDYSAGTTGGAEDAITDEVGKVSFDGKRARSPRLLGWVGNALNVVTQGVHASFGRHSYVFAFGRGMEGSPVVGGYIEDWTGEPEHMESRIIVKPVQAVSLRPKDQ